MMIDRSDGTDDGGVTVLVLVMVMLMVIMV
jgi:hypothetical protein